MTIFCPFTNLTTQKIKILEKKQNLWRYYHFTHVYHKWHIMYGSWDMEHKRQCFVILGHFLSFHPTNNPKNQNFEKMKKQTHGHIIFLHLSTTSEDHMMYGSWDIEVDGQSFFVILDYFFPFDPPNNSENLNFEKIKCIEISSFHTSVP